MACGGIGFYLFRKRRLWAETEDSREVLEQLLRQVFRWEEQQMEDEQLIVWTDFYKVIDSVYEGFYSRVVSGYGEILSEKEVQLCCLLCAGFSTKEISVLTGQKFQTIYQRKMTVRQKLGMGEKVDIVAFVSA